nr:MAG TPA: hypothetical protein [Caudoviricetes sp.]
MYALCINCLRFTDRSLRKQWLFFVLLCKRYDVILV